MVFTISLETIGASVQPKLVVDRVWLDMPIDGIDGEVFGMQNGHQFGQRTISNRDALGMTLQFAV